MNELSTFCSWTQFRRDEQNDDTIPEDDVISEFEISKQKVRPLSAFSLCTLSYEEKRLFYWTGVNATIVKRPIVCHVIDDFINDVDEHLTHASGTSTMSSFSSGFDEIDAMFLEFTEELDNPIGGPSSVGDNSSTSQPSATPTLRRCAHS
ncbi:cytochrome P450 CYP82D47-like [Cucumis melo var. makuwa]|uniref:Cytochrome P450 CYP82D47-like n=1 Tax=Cucumis melo var. makuwa TaxID=1194695 RepID=A0A5A7T5U4_CUCMM|nr:cytochrome P450 CYP82D47-like [Cucumis melo var. makuwa]